MSAITSGFSAMPGHRPRKQLNRPALTFVDYGVDPEGHEQPALDTPA